MKYELSCVLRFSDKSVRDALFSSLLKSLSSTFKNDNAFVEKHLCYNDEIPSKPCIPEEKVEANAV